MKVNMRVLQRRNETNFGMQIPDKCIDMMKVISTKIHDSAYPQKYPEHQRQVLIRLTALS